MMILMKYDEDLFSAAWRGSFDAHIGMLEVPGVRIIKTTLAPSLHCLDALLPNHAIAVIASADILHSLSSWRCFLRLW